MNTVKTWSNEWLLRLNTDKCKAVSYCLKTPLDAQYHIIDGNMSYNLEKLNSINDLGVIFDSNLTFKDHVAQKINKAYGILGIRRLEERRMRSNVIENFKIVNRKYDINPVIFSAR